MQENRISLRKANKVLLGELSVRSVYNFQTMLSKANQITVMYWYLDPANHLRLDYVL